MLWPIALGTVLLATSLTALPVSSDTEKDVSTLATAIMPPPAPKDIKSENTPMLFLINLFGFKNITGDEEVLQDDILSDVPDIRAPLASILLGVEADDKDTPVSLAEVSEDLKNERFKVDTIKGKYGEIKAIKIDIGVDDLTLSESSEEKKEGKSDALTTLRERRKAGQKGFERIRRKRHLCLKCKLNNLHEKIHEHAHGGGYGGYSECPTGNCGRGFGGNTIGVIPVAVVPVGRGYGNQGGYQGVYQGSYQGHQGHLGGGGCNTCADGGFQALPPPTPLRQTCNTCGGGYLQGGDGGHGYAQASAQASASAQSSSYY